MLYGGGAATNFLNSIALPNPKTSEKEDLRKPERGDRSCLPTSKVT